MITITIFASSLFFATFIIALKAFNIKSGREIRIHALIGKFDNKSTKLIANIKFLFFQTIQSIRYIFIVKIKDPFINFVTKEISRIANEYESSQRILMGRKDISKKGAVSFYLRKIEEERVNIGKGKIE